MAVKSERIPSATKRPGISVRRLVPVTLLAMLAATAANLVLYYAGGALFPAVTTWPGAGPGQIVGANSAYLFFGAVTLAVVARVASRPARHFLIVAVAGLLLSLALPISAGFGYGAPGASPADLVTIITLSLMHVVSFAISVPLFVRLTLD